MRSIILITVVAAFAASAPAKSLWVTKKNNEKGMYADRTATSIGDILLVMVEEETVVNRSASKTTSSNTNITHNMNNLHIPDVTRTLLQADLPSIGLAPGDSFNGSGSVGDSNVVEAKIAVQVRDVSPNGNLHIEGARKVETSGEVQYIVITGIVRRDDVTMNNTVMSYNIVNASVEILGEGDLMTAQRKNWINQLLDAVNIL